MNTSVLTFMVQSTGPDLHLTVKLDDHIIYDRSPSDSPENISYSFDDSVETEHLLCFEMSGKLPEHTTISESGEITQDRLIKISDVAFDDIILGQVFIEATKYRHDYNGTGNFVEEKFYGAIGCNGRVEMRFSTPIYLWLLENM